MRRSIRALFVLILIALAILIFASGVIEKGTFGLLMVVLAVSVFLRIIFDIINALRLAFTFGKYSRTVRTTQYSEILGPLINSQEEYCLILRPFGSDGETVIPNLGRMPQYGVNATFTLEQIVARTCRKSLGFKTYAMVDQDRRLAPPGPVYLRAPHDEWRVAAKELILRAYLIVLILPPRQEVREALWWELKLIVEHGLQSRMILLLPSPDQDGQIHTQARRQTAVILAALDDYLCFNDDDVDLHGNANLARIGDQVAYYEKTLPESLFAVHFALNEERGSDDIETTYWFMKKVRKSFVTRIFATAKNYEEVISATLAATRRALSKKDFAARYPWPRGYR